MKKPSKTTFDHLPTSLYIWILLQSDNELLVTETPENMGVTNFVLEIKRVENYHDFQKLALVIQHGLQGFIVKNVEGESKETNDLSHIL